MSSNFEKYLSHRYIDTPNEASIRLVRRARIQFEFARRFADVLGRKDWANLVNEAQRSMTSAGDGLEALAGALHEAEAKLAEIGVEAKKRHIHCVGHGHIDMNWMWSWPETVAATHDTFASVLSLMREYPTLTYSQSQGSVYAIAQQFHPDMFDEIRSRVKEGRWEVTASQWVEGDKNISSGESLCRHLLRTRAFFRETFAMEPEDQTIDWEPDSFGHAATLPAILTRGGVKHYYAWRQGGGFEHVRIGDKRPSLFYWKAPDGSKILVNKEQTCYNSYINIGENIALPLIELIGETGLHSWLNVYGIGNHGGGPTRKEIEYLIELSSWPIYPTVEFSTTNRYFKAIEDELAQGKVNPLPVIDHELNFECNGCYTSQSLIKQANRFGENYLIEAEALGAIANRHLSVKYPEEQMRDAWLKVLFNQFHDILPGSGVRQTREHATAAFQQVGAITGAVKRNALKAIIAKIGTEKLLPDTWEASLEKAEKRSLFDAGSGLGAMTSGISVSGTAGNRFRPIVVFNPCAYQRTERITVSLYDTNFDAANIVAVAEDGAMSPALCVGTNGNDWGHTRIDVAFDAADIPALGYRTFLLAQRSSMPQGASEADRSIPIGKGWLMTTPFLQYKIDRDQGGVVDVVDLRSGAVLSACDSRSPMGAFKFVTERPIGMSAWMLGSQTDPEVPLKMKGINMRGASVQDGTALMPSSAPFGVECEQHLGVSGTESMVRLRQTVHTLEPRMDFAAEIDWREIGSHERGIPSLIISIPLPLTDISTRYETPFGSIVRALYNGEEVPSLRYAHVEGTAQTADGKPVHAGVTLLQDCKYGHSIAGNDRDGYTLRLRIVRSSYSPDPAPEIATTTVRFSLYFHAKPADPAMLARLGEEWNSPLIALPAPVQAGDAPLSHSYAKVISQNVALTALKLPENGASLVLRLVELNGVEGDAKVEISDELLQGATSVRCVDILERPIEGAASLKDGLLTVPMSAYSIATVLIG